MTTLERILAMSDEERAAQGLVHTPAEIAQQPACWRATLNVVKQSAQVLADFVQPSKLAGNPRARIVLCGAGTSEFIGDSVEQALRKTLKVDCDSRPTTDVITSWQNIFLPERDYLAVSFARSGNSPESVATYDIIKKKVPGARQLVITCNSQGELAKRAANDEATYCLVLPPETNDNGLAMTSSYSSMAIAAMSLGFLDKLDEYERVVEQLCAQAECVLSQSEAMHELASREWRRGVFLGDGALYGAAREAHLKVSELTDGMLMCRYDSYTGLRHGPQVVIKDTTFVAAFIASDAHTRKYELDLLRELKRQGRFGALLVVGPNLAEGFAECATMTIETPPFTPPGDDVFGAPVAVIVGQLFGMYASMRLGLKPDTPSADGVINRVVQGVTIYEID